MPLHLLHTSDWHLGATLGPAARDDEHRLFLAWLLEVLTEQQIDVLVLAGDIFQLAQPSADAQRMYYRFLAEVGRKTHVRQVVVVGGNHDSASRLDAPREVLDVLNVHVVGGLSGGADEDERCLCPIRGPAGEVEAVVVAVPFVHEFRLGVRLAGQPADELQRAFVEAFARLYERLADLAEQRFPGVPLIATGHLTAAGTLKEEYGTEIHQVGTIAGLPGSIFDPRFDYVALGHIHRMFPIQGSRAWYSGSPLPMRFEEARSPRFVLKVTVDPSLAAEDRVHVQPLPVPCWRDLVELRGRESEIKAALARLRSDRPLPPLIHVDLEVDALTNTATQGLLDAVAPRPDGSRPVVVDVRQIRMSADTSAAAEPVIRLADLTPEQVFVRLHLARNRTEPDSAVLQAFRALLSETD